MKKNNIIKGLLFILALPVLFLACEDETNVNEPAAIDFGSIASGYDEKSGTGNVTIPFRNADASKAAGVEVKFGGTAREGVDFNLVGITEAGVQISIIDDDSLEVTETIRVIGNFSGNNTHNITIVSNCEDKAGLKASDFAGDYDALEDYTSSDNGTFGPYPVTLVQDAVDLNKFTFTNFYGGGATWKGIMIFDIAAGTVKFPDQVIKGISLTKSSGKFDLCTSTKTMNIDLNFDGLDWTYRFTKH